MQSLGIREAGLNIPGQSQSSSRWEALPSPRLKARQGRAEALAPESHLNFMCMGTVAWFLQDSGRINN